MSRCFAAGSIALVSFLTLAGCNNRPARVNPPAIDARLAAQQALAQYDTNGDGTLDGAELDKVPAIKNSLKEMDKDGDGRISGDEIRERIEQWQASRVAIMPFNCRVTLDRAPLVDAVVTLVPEKFLGPNVQSASGTVGEQGMAMLTIPKDKMPNPKFSGVNAAFYKIEISRLLNDAESLPDRYNSNTELGQEVSPSVPARQTIVTFDLKSR